MENIEANRNISNLPKDFFLEDQLKIKLIDIIIENINVENILDLYNPKLKDLYLKKVDENYKQKTDLKDVYLEKFKVLPSNMNNEEKMLYSFFTPKNMEKDLPELLDYINDTYNRICIVNKKNESYISGNKHEIYMFIIKECAEHYFSSKLKVYMTDDDEEENYERREMTAEETQIQVDEIMQHPLFMTEIPEDITGNVHLEAIRAIKYEENSQNICDQGIELSESLLVKYLKSKDLKTLKECMLNIVNTIDHCILDKEVSIQSRISSLFFRIKLNMMLKNWSYSIEDLGNAFKIYKDFFVENQNENVQKDFIKEYITNEKESRDILFTLGSKYTECFTSIKKFKEAKTILEDIKAFLSSSLKNKMVSDNYYNDFLKSCYFLNLDLIEQKYKEYIESINQIDTIKFLNESEKDNLLEQLSKVGINLGKQYHKIPIHCEAKIYKSDDCFHFPILIIYEEFNMTDYIQDFHQDNCIGDILDILFEEKLPWDKQGIYSRLSVQMYFESMYHVNNSVHTYYYPLKKEDLLIDILKNKRIIMNGLPIIHIISTKSKYLNHFMKTKIVLKRKNLR